MSSSTGFEESTERLDKGKHDTGSQVRPCDSENGLDRGSTRFNTYNVAQHVALGQHGPTSVIKQSEATIFGLEEGSEHKNGGAEEESMGQKVRMEFSPIILKPMEASEDQQSVQENDVYVDPTPETPSSSQPPSRSASTAISLSRPARTSDLPDRSPSRSDASFDENLSSREEESEAHSKSEIHTIMEQFSKEGLGPGQEEIMSPRLEIAGPLLGSASQYPPRKSSLEPVQAKASDSAENSNSLRALLNSSSELWNSGETGDGLAVTQTPNSSHNFGRAERIEDKHTHTEASVSPHLHRPPPPDPEPESDLPFDFHRFLEQLRHRTADPVAKFLRSFLQEFGKKQWMVHEQVKIIGDFLAFITNKMTQCEVWRNVSDAEFDNAREGMEKLVMNRLYAQTFSPAIPLPQPIPGLRSGRRGFERSVGPGRKGQHQEDVERDQILAQKISIYGWVREAHLDIPLVGESGKRFLGLAQQELLKIKTYRAPRDKIICVLNCCKVIFGLLKHSKADSSADSFMPLLIYVVLQANPDHLVSNVQYILRFRNQEKLAGEAGYYLSSLMGAVQFIEGLDRTSLTISEEEFEKSVEAAVSSIAEKHKAEEAAATTTRNQPERLANAPPETDPQRSVEGQSSIFRSSNTSTEKGNADGMDEKAATNGLLRTIQRPLSSIGRIFTEEGIPTQTGPGRTPVPGNASRRSPNPMTDTYRRASPSRAAQSQITLNAEDAAARQASAESAEAIRIQQAEHANVVETLTGMFPDLDRELISDVVTQKDGRVGLAVDACLALSS